MSDHSSQPPQIAVRRPIGARFWLAAGRALAASGRGSLATVRAAGALIDGLKPFAWPAVVLFVFLRYEGPMFDLLDRISEADTPFGKITFDRSGVRDTGDDLTQLVAALAEQVIGGFAPGAGLPEIAAGAPAPSDPVAAGRAPAAIAEIEVEPVPPPPPNPDSPEEAAARLAVIAAQQAPPMAQLVPTRPVTPDFITRYVPVSQGLAEAANATRQDLQVVVQRMARNLQALDAYLGNVYVAPVLNGLHGYYDLVAKSSYLKSQVAALEELLGGKAGGGIAADIEATARAVDGLFIATQVFLNIAESENRHAAQQAAR